MKKAIAIVIQILIFVGAWFILTPDTLEDNTYIFGLFGDVEVIKGNSIWVMIGAGVLSVLNISYKEWFGKIWQFLLEFLVVLLIIFVILASI